MFHFELLLHKWPLNNDQQRPLFFGPKSGHWTQVWLYIFQVEIQFEVYVEIKQKYMFKYKMLKMQC
jgi:hypothetical protein